MLAQRKKKIRKNKPLLSTVGDFVDRTLTPSNKKDWHKIRYYNRLDKSVKDEFRNESDGFPGDIDEKVANVALVILSAYVGTKCFPRK
ncbi:hypothetical protein OS493_026710 [Desmophyllum pertusum]|uniref:Uncharacterized protein n=1 Tax=Desmophyllum pertusum TaxID=174260 RepID=A0A9W9ZZ68_9CNID|nr:hypothetical protein OS493_026710 [Desmophyllum pertusum]